MFILSNYRFRDFKGKLDKGGLDLSNQNYPPVMYYQKLENGNYKASNAMLFVPGHLQPNNSSDANDRIVLQNYNAKKLLVSLQNRNTDQKIEDIKNEIKMHDIIHK